MSAIDSTHNPALRSWVESAAGHGEFPIQNLPLGIFSRAGEKPRPGIAIGDRVLDLPAVSNLLPRDIEPTLASDRLNDMLALAPAARAGLRGALSALLCDEAHRPKIEPHLRDASECTLHLPVQIGDYTDFYVGIHHATNVGRQFRPDNPLLPNYKYIPIGYHGRSSSVRASGAAVRRPRGQIKPADAPPSFGRTRRLDYEVELGVWIGGGNALGEPIGIAEAPSHIAGLSLLNDWSARDIQAWEYQPLGPFLSKSFLTTVSPWIITSEALAPFRVPQPRAARGRSQTPRLPVERRGPGARRLCDHARGLDSDRGHAGKRYGGTPVEPRLHHGVVLDGGPDDRASHLQRLQLAAGRSVGDRNDLRAAHHRLREPARDLPTEGVGLSH